MPTKQKALASYVVNLEKTKRRISNNDFSGWKYYRDPAYVYLVESEGYHKIGHATNMDGRLNSLRCGNPYPVNLIAKKKIQEYMFAEDLIHWILEERHHYREWFKLESEFEVQNIIEYLNTFQ